MKTYLVVRLKGTDEDFEVVQMSKREILELIEKDPLEQFAVIDGQVVKTASRKLDIGRLRDD